VDPMIVVLRAGLDQQHPQGAVRTQAVGDERAGCTRADDNVVEGRLAHQVMLLFSPVIVKASAA